MNKIKFQKILNDKKLTETLMSDEKFKKEVQETLKKENINITDEELKNILRATEKILLGDIKNEKELENVVGGISGKSLTIGCAKGIFTILSGVVNAVPGAIAGGTICGAIGEKLFPNKSGKLEDIGSIIGAIAGLAVGSISGYKLGDRII